MTGWKSEVLAFMLRRTFWPALAVVMIVLFGAVLLVFGPLQRTPIPPGTPGGELAFLSDRSGQWDIYLIDTAGELLNLTAEGEGDDYFPSWSFDGELINFLSNRSGEMGPAQVRPDGTGLHTLSVARAIVSLFGEGQLDWDPHWEPRGNRVLWASLRDLNLELYLADADGSNRTRLTQHPARDWFPAWSPDGVRVLFNSDREGAENLYLLDLTSSELTQLTDGAWDEIRGVWSLDGNAILFVSEAENLLRDGQLDLYRMNPEGGDIRPLRPGEAFRADMKWTSDGGQLAYMSNEEGRWSIYVMDSDGSNIRRLTDLDANDLFPVWRPRPAAED
jgi:Tol biopolymer transport system component